MILTPLQKLPSNVGDLGKIIAANGFEWLTKKQKIAQSGHTDHHQQPHFPNFCKITIPAESMQTRFGIILPLL